MAKTKTNDKVVNADIKAMISEEQLSDVLLLIDKKNKTSEVVKEIDKAGNVKTVPAKKERENEFLQIGNNSDALDIAVTAIKNFYSQARDPTQFEILKVPFNFLKNSGLLLKELLKSNRSPTADEFADKHRIETSTHSTAQTQINDNQKQSVMAKQEQTSTTGTQEQPVQTERTQRFQEAMIDWKSIENFGISREYLKDKGLLDSMLKGYKTPQLVPVNLNLGSAVIKTDARLSFQQSIGGPVVLAVHGLRQEPPLQRPYFGHIFSEEDKKNLRESGNMGRTVELKDRNQEYHPYLISIDKLTNEIVGTRADKVFIPNEVSGVKLTDEEKEDLRSGKKIPVEGMIAKSGREFSAELQLNAERRGIEYLFPKNEQQNNQIIGGVELSPQQHKDLSEGKAIFVEDMVRKSDGEKFSSFIKKDEATNNLSYTRYNPDSAEGAREIYIPKEIGGVVLQSDEREDLRKGLPIFLDGMVNRKGEEFSSYIKADTETGKLSYSSKPDGFAQSEQLKIPAEVFGVTLNVKQRAQLQDGKAVLVEGMKGFDQKEFSAYLKVSANQGKIDYYTQNPDKPKVTQGNANPATTQTQDRATPKATNATAAVPTQGTNETKNANAVSTKPKVANGAKTSKVNKPKGRKI